MIPKKYRAFALGIISLLAFGIAGAQSSDSSKAAAFNLKDVFLAPTRVIFEGRDRTAEVMLMNKSDRTLTYALKFINLRMSETGETREIDAPAPGEQFADSMIRFTPRRVILEPNQSQVVRVQLRKPSGLPAGEYRSHLVFQVVPNTTNDDASDDSPAGADAIGITLIPVYGVSIPIIVREGATSAKVTLSNMAIIEDPGKGGKKIKLDINRIGNQSVYGDIEVEYVLNGYAPIVLGRIKGIAVYTPNSRRIVTVSLQFPEGLSLKANGAIRVTYFDPTKGKSDVASIFASGAIALP